MHNSKNTRADRKDGNFNRMSAEAFKPKVRSGIDKEFGSSMGLAENGGNNLKKNNGGFSYSNKNNDVAKKAWGSRFDILGDDMDDVLEIDGNQFDNKQKAVLTNITNSKVRGKANLDNKKKDKVVGEDSQLYMKSSLDTVKKTFPSSCSSGIESKIRKAKSKGKKKIDSSREEAADTMLEDVGVLQQLHLDIQTSMEASQHFN
ncbi:hypothetical protein ACOSQ2_013281 [Xanthoceras sorbifolium]